MKVRRPVVADKDLPGPRVVRVESLRIHGVGNHPQADGPAPAGLPCGAPVVRQVRLVAQRRPHDRLRIGRNRYRAHPAPAKPDRPRGLPSKRLPGPRPIQGVLRRDQVVLVGVAAPDKDLRVLPGEHQASRVLEPRSVESQVGRGHGEVVVAEAIDVPQPAHQGCALRRACQGQRNGFLNAGVVKAPVGGLPEVGVFQVVRHPDAIPRREDGMVRVERVDFDVGQPVVDPGRRVRRARMVPLGVHEQGFPGSSPVRAAKDHLEWLSVAPGRRNDGSRMLGVDRHGSVPKLAFRSRLLRRDIGPAPAGRVQLPDCAVGHSVGARLLAVAEV